jgi:hypothetical protein
LEKLLDEKHKDALPGDPTFRYGVPRPPPMKTNFKINPGTSRRVDLDDDGDKKEDEAIEVTEKKRKSGDGSKEKRKRAKKNNVL